MRQVWITKKGGPEVLKVQEAPDPEPGEGQVRIKVEVAGVNFADNAARQGLYPDAPKLPCVVGYEVSGVVDKLGPKSTGPAIGTRVLALCRFGGYSSMVVVPEGSAIPIPDDMTFEQGAAIPVTYLTAWLMLVWHANVREGETVLVHAAAGGVGQAALQICNWRKAKVIGTASKGKHERLRSLGVAHCIDYTTQDFEEEVKTYTKGHGVDIVLDAVGGESFGKSYRSLAPLGKMFVFGGSAFISGNKMNILHVVSSFFKLPKFKPLTMMGDNRGVFGVNLGHLWDEQPKLIKMMTEIVDLAGKKVFTPVIDRVFPFDQAAEAHALIGGRQSFGKVLLKP